MRALIAFLLFVPLTGCYVTMQGYQSTSGGTTTTTTSSDVSGSAKFSGGKASFSSGGHSVSPKAPGGYVKLSGNAAAVLVVGVVIADFLNYVSGGIPPKPLPPGTNIADTCSCYGYKPPLTDGRSAP